MNSIKVEPVLFLLIAEYSVASIICSAHNRCSVCHGWVNELIYIEEEKVVPSANSI